MKEYWEGDLHCKTGGVGGPVEEMDFSCLIGATIQNVGFHPKAASEGGLTIDYIKDGVDQRIVLGFNELGLWREWEGQRNTPSKQDLLLQRISEIVESDDWSILDVIDDPKNRCYHFDAEGRRLLTLNLTDIMLLPENIRSQFSKPDKEERDTGILTALSMVI